MLHCNQQFEFESDEVAVSLRNLFLVNKQKVEVVVLEMRVLVHNIRDIEVFEVALDANCFAMLQLVAVHAFVVVYCVGLLIIVKIFTCVGKFVIIWLC